MLEFRPSWRAVIDNTTWARDAARSNSVMVFDFQSEGASLQSYGYKRKKQDLYNLDLGNRHNELSTTPTVLGLLLQNLIDKIPRQEQNIVRLICQQFLR